MENGFLFLMQPVFLKTRRRMNDGRKRGRKEGRRKGRREGWSG